MLLGPLISLQCRSRNDRNDTELARRLFFSLRRFRLQSSECRWRSDQGGRTCKSGSLSVYFYSKSYRNKHVKTEISLELLSHKNKHYRVYPTKAVSCATE